MVLWSRGKGVMSRPDAGGRTSLLVQLTGPQPLTRTVMVTTPAPLRVVASGASSGRWLVYTSGPLRPDRRSCCAAPTRLASSHRHRWPWPRARGPVRLDYVSYIEILILRRLRGGPAHGYELRKRVEETTGFVLHNNSLYPALRRFEEAARSP